MTGAGPRLEGGAAIGGRRKGLAPRLADAVDQSPVTNPTAVSERWPLPRVMGGRRRGRTLPHEHPGGKRAIGALHDLSRRSVAACRRLAHDQHQRDDGDPGQGYEDEEHVILATE